MESGIGCQYQRTCGGEDNCLQALLRISDNSKLNPESKRIRHSYLEKNPIENTSKIQISRSVTEAKPSPKHKSSDEAYANFVYILNNIIKIQRSYQLYIRRKKLKSQLRASSTIDKCIPLSNANDYPVHDEANGEISQTLSNSNLFLKVNINRSSTSIFSRTLSSMSEAVNDGGLKGYFLKKKSKFTYKGGLLQKRKEGFGIVTWEDGSTLHARFENSRAQGYCKFVDSNGLVFTGLYDNNKPCGYGICVLTSIKVKYEGFWHKNNQIRIGIEVWDDDTYYQGEYDTSKKKGIGLYRWADGTIYRGEWNENRMSGYGLINYSDDRTYAGQVLNGEINGFGEFTWKDGGRYIGNYLKEQKQGFGVFIWNKKPISAYVGFWLDGRQQGVGLKITHLVGRYGVWKDGSLDFWLQGSWVIKQHLKPDQLRYEKFLSKSISFIMSLFNPLK